MGCYSIDRGNYERSIQIIKEHKLKITITPLGEKSKSPHRRVTYMQGLMPQGELHEVETTDSNIVVVDLLSYSNTLNNLLEACINRVFLVERNGVLGPPPEPLPGIFLTLYPAADHLASLLDDHELMTHDEYVAESPAHRRKCYRIAADNLKIQGMQERWKRLKLFVKFQREEGKAARVICPTTEEAIVQEGCFVKSLEKRRGGIMSLYEGIDQMWQDTGVQYPVCSKGHTQKNWAAILHQKWLSFAVPCEVDFDCSRFSQHTRQDALDLFSYLVTKVFPESEKTMHNGSMKSTVRLPDEFGVLHEVSVKLPCMLYDGTPKTAASAHVIINLIMMAYFKMIGVAVEPLDCGDDFSIICDLNRLPDMAHLQQYLLDFGYTLKIETSEPVTLFNKISFCRSSPVNVRGEWTMIRPPICLVKDALLMCQERDMHDRLFAVGMGGCHANFGVPVYHNFYRAMLRFSGRKLFKPKHMAFLYASNYLFYDVLSAGLDFAKSQAITYSDEDRASFCLTTGISCKCQVALEEFYDRVTLGSSHSVWWTPW